MANGRHLWGRFILVSAVVLVSALASWCGSEKELPALGRDTVLVWQTVNQDYSATLVVRIAEFSPDRFMEWEDSSTQGTIFIPSAELEGAKGYVSSGLFKAGIDSRAKNATTLWLSGRIFRELKENKRAKLDLDGVPGLMNYVGDDHLTVNVNRTPMDLPVIKISDDRGSERWFLDNESNPLMLKHSLRQYSQTLASITTDKSNTLRWIKGPKLTNLPH